MKRYQVLIVGAGPGGTACAQKLVEAGVNCLLVDKQTFPRQKTCAGWISPAVWQDLGVSPRDYPLGLTAFPSLKIFLKGFPINLPGKQYAIRRYEFDRWLLEKSGAELRQHEVKRISKTEDGYVIDGQFQAEYLVGAGGTHCPVYRSFWTDCSPRKGNRIVALETEYQVDWIDPTCRLWFFSNRLPGYAWYVPKVGGFLNIGLGGNAAVLKERGISIQDHWKALIQKLFDLNLIGEEPPEPRGYVYYLRGDISRPAWEKAYLVGDAAGLATVDMGEGIGPAIRSGQLAAEAIISGEPYNLSPIPPYSLLPPGLRWLVDR